MDDTNTQNQSLGTLGNLSAPPAPPVVDPVVPGSLPIPETPVSPDPQWPTKKKSKLKPILGGILALLLVSGVAFGAFYFTRNLNQAATLNAPKINPFAREAKEPPVKAGNKSPSYSQDYIEGDYNDRGTVKLDVSKADPDVVNTKNDTGDAPGGYYSCGDDEYCKVGAVENKDSGDGGGGGSQTASCTVSTWTPAENTVCSGTAFTQTNNCGGTRSATGTKTDGTCVACTLTVPTNATVEKLSPSSVKLKWSPGANGATQQLFVSKHTAPIANCLGSSGDVALCMVNRLSLSASASAHTLTGLTASTTYYWRVQNYESEACYKPLDSVINFTTDACVDTTWTPATSTVCSEEVLTQTSNCGTEREADGTKECGLPELSMEKRAYRDETSNIAGNYKLRNEINTVSKDEVFVYAFEIANSGTAKAENVVVVDTLKGDNQELLTFVDADARCKYTSSTRQVACSGMNIEEEETDAYTIRVKVSNSAVNGETINNVGTLSYKDMPSDGEIEASLELAISTIVGCNHVCTGDSECVSGLSCDSDTNKCRKTACLDSSSCNCPVERVITEAPTKRVTAVKPTILPETGILDFPGVAAFGGGLLLAIVGILLAL